MQTISTSGATGSLVTFKYDSGPDCVVRYNLYPAAAVQGSAVPGVSTGQSLQLMQQIVHSVLPFGFAFE